MTTAVAEKPRARLPLRFVEYEGRFRIAYRDRERHFNFGRHKVGWVVVDCDDGDRVITIAFETFAEAAGHRKVIAEAYKRWGW